MKGSQISKQVNMVHILTVERIREWLTLKICLIILVGCIVVQEPVEPAETVQKFMYSELVTPYLDADSGT